MNIKEKISIEQIIKWRRYLHEHPEVSFKEVETAKYIYNELSKFPNLILSTPTENSVVAILKGNNTGKTIALRADIDALPIVEEADVDFKSKNHGAMHACGHDTHTAMLLGAVKYLSQIPEKLAGTVKFIFQPAEECPPGGAKAIVEAGIIDDVDFIFGLHIFPRIETGHIGIVNGPLTASADIFEINIQGMGSHGSMPELAIDPILTGVEIINNLNNIVSRNISPMDNAVISIGQFVSGEVHNIIPDTADIKGTVRANNNKTRLFLKKRIEEVVEHVCKLYGANYNLEYNLGYSSVINDIEAADIVRNSAKKIVGEQGIFISPQIMVGEDFSAYTDVTKGAFFILGGGSNEKGYKYINHNPNFIIDEKALTVGTLMHIQIILDTIGVGILE